MAWIKGPMPRNTWNWGGVVPVDMAGSGFLFADFQGDHVLCIPGKDGQPRRLECHEVAYYDNSLTLPPKN